MTNAQLNHQEHQPGQRKYPVSLLVHDFSSPENVGSIYRIADALGLEKIYFSGSSPAPPNPKIKKTSRSTENFVSYEYQEDPFQIISGLKNEGYTIISLEITSLSTDIRKLGLKNDEKICLILGSENHGISQNLIDESKHTIHIPMIGQNSSMNVAVACGIACWEIIRGIE